MTPYLLIAVTALLLAVGGTPLLRKMALRWSVTDAPSGRKIHARPVPLLGGAAIYLAFMLVLFF
ncbi:MAG: undecaprenyl/decaprenyl-phosphate alpha-N-acetylglucosaminyl 1-phosphate transferase, partial [Litorilinea sp.]